MTTKEIPPRSVNQLPKGWQTTANTVGLHALTLQMWRYKGLFFIITILFSIAGAGYSLLAPQQWSAKAVISEPKPEDLMPMRVVMDKATALGLTGFPDGKALYQEFIQDFNAYKNRQDYLKTSPLFTQYVKEQGLGDKEARRWLRDWGQLVIAKPMDKKIEKEGEPTIVLNVVAPTAADSLAMLEGYIGYIVKLQQLRLTHRMDERRTLKLQEITARYALMQEDSKSTLQHEISETALANRLAQAAGVIEPLKNYRTQDRLSIALGSKGLKEKLALLKSLKLEVYNPELQELQVQIARLRLISLEGISFRPFTYQDAPEEPLNRDKPQGLLIVVLATLLGSMLGIGFVLVRYAFSRPEQA